MKFNILIKYLKYKIISRHFGGHGLHSPFIFYLVSGVFRNKIDSEVVLNIENIRKKLLNDKRYINVTDLGSGSVRLKQKVRKVSDIARYSSVPKKYGRLLSNMACEYGNGYIIEMGTSLGVSTMYLASGSRQNRVITIEGCREISDIASENFRSSGFDNISLSTGSFDEFLPSALDSGNPGIIYIDGDHRKQSLLRYFSLIEKKSGAGTVVIIDDIHLSDEMEEAWMEIRKSENVSLSVDIFRMGIVFFRKGLTKAFYTVRY